MSLMWEPFSEVFFYKNNVEGKYIKRSGREELPRNLFARYSRSRIKNITAGVWTSVSENFGAGYRKWHLGWMISTEGEKISELSVIADGKDKIWLGSSRKKYMHYVDFIWAVSNFWL